VRVVDRKKIYDAITPVKDPEIGIGVVDLGLIYDVLINDDSDVIIKMTLTTPACPYGPELIAAVKEAAQTVENVKSAKVQVVWEPPWNPVDMASDYAKDVLGIW